MGFLDRLFGRSGKGTSKTNQVENNKVDSIESLMDRYKRGENLSIEELEELAEGATGYYKRLAEGLLAEAAKTEAEAAKREQDLYKEVEAEAAKTEADIKKIDSSVRELGEYVGNLPGTKKMDQMVKDVGNSLLNRYRVTPADVNAKNAEAKKKKDEFFQEHQYAQIIDDLIEHLMDSFRLYKGEKESISAQIQYDKLNLKNKEIVFLPYLMEFEEKTGVLPDNLPENIRKMYNRFKNCDDRDKSLIIRGGLMLEQLLGIVDLEDPNIHQKLGDLEGKKGLKKICEEEGIQVVEPVLSKCSDIFSSRGER